MKEQTKKILNSKEEKKEATKSTSPKPEDPKKQNKQSSHSKKEDQPQKGGKTMGGQMSITNFFKGSFDSSPKKKEPIMKVSAEPGKF